jgi:hypothetical protein
MEEKSKQNIESVSKLLARRAFFKNMAFLGLVMFSTSKLHAKGSKKQYQYQETPKNGEACKDCNYFEPKSNTCKVVEGSISPQGWCALYLKAPQ